MNRPLLEATIQALCDRAENAADSLFSANLMAAVIADRNGDSRALALHIKAFFEARIDAINDEIKTQSN